MKMPTQYEIGQAIAAANLSKYVIKADGMWATRHPTRDALTIKARSCAATVTLTVEASDLYLLEYVLEPVERLMSNHDKPVDGCEWCPMVEEMKRQR